MHASTKVALTAIAAAGAMLIATTGRPAPPLTTVERQIVAAVDAAEPAAQALLEEVVNINSGTLNVAGVRAVGERFRIELDHLGFQTRWIDGAAFGRAGHLVAERTGAGPRILLIGHLDTVFDRDSPFQKYERLDPHTARGPGIIDMKGGDVIILTALKALSSAGVLDSLQVAVILTGDEEDTGRPLDASREALRTLADRSDVALGFEDGAGDPRQAITARRGYTGWQVVVHATSAHSSQVFQPEVGAGAAYELARVLNGFYAALSARGLLTANPGWSAAGTRLTTDDSATRAEVAGKSNVVASQGRAAGDLRAISAAQLAAAKEAMRRVAAKALPRTRTELTFDDGYPPMSPTAGNARLLAAYDRASRDLGFGPVVATDPRNAGAADIAFTAGRVTMALDGIGLMGHDDHTDRETADLRTLGSQAKRAALVMYRLGRDGTLPR